MYGKFSLKDQVVMEGFQGILNIFFNIIKTVACFQEETVRTIEHCYELPKEETVDIFMSNVVGAKEDLVVSLVKAAQILHVLSSLTGLDGHVTFHDIGNTTVRSEKKLDW